MAHISPRTERSVSDPTVLYRVLLKEQDMYNESLTNENAALRAEVRVLQERAKAGVFSRLASGGGGGGTKQARGHAVVHGTRSPLRGHNHAAIDDGDATVSCSVPSCHRNRTLRRPTLRSSLASSAATRPRRPQPLVAATDHPAVPAIYATSPLGQHQQRDVSTISRISFDMQTQTERGGGGGGGGGVETAAVSPLPRPPYGELQTGDDDGGVVVGPRRTEGGMQATTSSVMSSPVRGGRMLGTTGAETTGRARPPPELRCDGTTQTHDTVPNQQPEMPTAVAPPRPPPIVLPERAAMTTLLRELLVFVMQDDVILGRRSETDAVASHITFEDASSSELYRSLRKQIYRLKRRVQHTLTDMGKLQHMVAVYREASMAQLSSTHQDAMLDMADVLHGQQQPASSAAYAATRHEAERGPHRHTAEHQLHEQERPRSSYARTRLSNRTSSSGSRLFDMRVNVEQNLSSASLGSEVGERRPLRRQDSLPVGTQDSSRPGRVRDHDIERGSSSAIGDVSAMSAQSRHGHDDAGGYAHYSANHSVEDGDPHPHQQRHILCNHGDVVHATHPGPQQHGSSMTTSVARSPPRQRSTTVRYQGDDEGRRAGREDPSRVDGGGYEPMMEASESPLYPPRPKQQLRVTSVGGGRNRRQHGMHGSNDTADSSGSAAAAGLLRSGDATNSRLLMEAIAQQCSMASAASSRLSVNPLNVDQLCASASSYAGSPLRGLAAVGAQSRGTTPQPSDGLRYVGSPQAAWLSPTQKRLPPRQYASDRGRSSAEEGVVVGASLSESNASRFSTLRGDTELDRYVQWKRDFVQRLSDEQEDEDEDAVRREDTGYDEDVDDTG